MISSALSELSVVASGAYLPDLGHALADCLGSPTGIFAGAIAPGPKMLTTPIESGLRFLRHEWTHINWVETSLYLASTALIFVFVLSVSDFKTKDV